MILRKFLLILTLLSCSVSFAQYKKLEEVDKWVNKINEQTKQINNLHASFMQKKVISFLENPVVSSGEFWFQKTDKIRWEYTHPYSYVMIMNGGILSVIDEGNQYTTDLSSNKMFEQMNGLISGSISGELLNKEAEYKQEFYENEKDIIIRFIPKSGELGAYLQHIEIWFNRQSLQVDQLIMSEASGDYTEIQFSERKTNQEIPSHVFQ